MQLPGLRSRPRDHRRDPGYLEAWGTHPSWSRLLGSPVLYEQIEERLTELLGSDDSLVLPTITHIHMSVIPLLAASGTIFLDARAHKTIYDGCQVARSRGAAVRRFRFEDPDHLDELLRAESDRTRLVCMDGVNSMTGNPPDLRAFAEVARRHGALLTSTTRMASVSSANGTGRSDAVRPARQQHHAPCRRELRRHRIGGRVLKGLLVAAGVHRLPDRGQAPAEGRGTAVSVLGAVAGRVARDGAGRYRRQRAPRRRAARRSVQPHRARADGARPARRRDAEPLGPADHRDPASSPRPDRRRRALPVRSRGVRDARRLPAGPEGRGRLPRPADGGQHRRRGRSSDRGARGARRARRARSARAAAERTAAAT